MQLKRAYAFHKNLPADILQAVDIANSLVTNATDEQVEEVLSRIPESPNYSTFVTYPGGYGTEIYILYPVESC
jgi:hypothetical protein